MVARPILLILAVAVAVGSAVAVAKTAMTEEDKALADARREAEEAMRRSAQLEREAAAATSDAARMRADAAALAARIEAGEADITAAETRLRSIERLRAAQRARLAERQEPVVRLTGALQMMARRPPALALVQPGSLDDLVHVRALLASTLPIIRNRTAALRAEVEQGKQLSAQAERAVSALVASREELKRRRVALARLEASQLRRSESLAESALFESDRALAFGEEARELSIEMGKRQYLDQLRRELSELPGPVMRPGGEAAAAPNGRRYILPVDGRVVRGMGEISDAGVHARGITMETSAGATVRAPARGTIVYAGRFRSYGNILIIDHGKGWTTTLTDLATMTVRTGDRIAMGDVLGRAGGTTGNMRVELRRNGEPVAIPPLLG
jgi:septal ring factor EnvC (AmiA/AmiB activator)